MIHIECAVPVHASPGVAWRILTETAESPERFVPRISAAEVLGRGEDEFVRRVHFDDGTDVTERVVLVPDERVIFQFVDHPKFDGEIGNRLFRLEQEVWLSFYFRGRPKQGVDLGPGELEQIRDGFARAVRLTARRMEEEERGALKTG